MSHFPGHLREAFTDWINAGKPATVTVDVDYQPTEWPARKLLGRMAHCTDILPGGYCDELGMPQGVTYAAAAQRLLHD